MADSGIIGVHPEVITGSVFFKNETSGLTEHMEVGFKVQSAACSLNFLVPIANIQIRYSSGQSRFGESNWILGLPPTEKMEL